MDLTAGTRQGVILYADAAAMRALDVTSPTVRIPIAAVVATPLATPPVLRLETYQVNPALLGKAGIQGIERK